MDCDSSFPDEKSAKYLWSQGEEMEGCFEGWQDYPTNLNHYDPMLEDGQRYQDRLEDLSGSLFSDKVALHVIDANGKLGFTPSSGTVLNWHFAYRLPFKMDKSSLRGVYRYLAAWMSRRISRPLCRSYGLCKPCSDS